MLRVTVPVGNHGRAREARAKAKAKIEPAPDTAAKPSSKRSTLKIAALVSAIVIGGASSADGG